MVKKRDKPYIWVTWVVDVMSGKVPCHWKYHFKALNQQENQDKRVLESDLNSWRIKHTKLLTELRKGLQENKKQHKAELNLRLDFEGRCLIAGKADCVEESVDEVVYYDCKTGARDEAHKVQLQIYMWMDKKLKLHPDKILRGELIYGEQHLSVPEPDENFEKGLQYFIEQILDTNALKSSGDCCKNCDIMVKDCPDCVAN